MPRMLGDAFIVISPLTDDFGAEAQAGIKRQLAGIHPTIEVGADVSGVPAAVAALMNRLRQASQGRVAFADLIDLNVPQGQIVTQLLLLKRLIQHAGLSDMLGINLNDAQIREQLQKIASLSENIDIGANTGNAEQAIGLLQGQLNGLELRLSRLTANLNDTDAMTKIGELEQMAAALYDQLDNLTADVDVTDAMAKIYDVEAEIKALSSDAGVVRLQADISGVTAAIAAVQAKLAGLKNVSENIDIGANVSQAVASLAALTGAEKAAGASAQESAAQLLAMAAASGNAADAAKLAYAAQVAQTIALGGVAKATSATNTQVAAGIPLWTNGAGIFGAWTGKVALFGGALAKVPLLASISAWHLLAESILEFAATLIPATIAITAWGVAAANTFVDVAKRAQSLYTAQQALQQAFTLTFTNVATGVTTTRNLVAQFQQLQAVVKPQVYTLLGEALYVVQQRAGTLNPLIAQAGKVIDDLGARFAYAVTTGNAFDVFIKNGAQDLAGWGNLIGNIGGIIGGILKQLPGYGEIFLSVLDNVTHAIEIFVNSGFGQALLGFGLAAHGAIIWIGLLSTAFTFLATRALAGLAGILLNVGVALDKLGVSAAAGVVANLGRSLGLVAASAGPLIGIISVVAAGVGFLVYNLLHAKDAVQQFFSSLQQQAQQVPLLQLTSTLAAQAAVAQQDLAAATAKTAAAQSNLYQAVKTAPGAFGIYANAVASAQKSQADYQAGLAGIQGEQATLNQHVQQAAGIFGSTSAAWAVLNGAGVTSAQILSKNAQTWGEALIEAQAYNAVLRQVFDSTGRYAAAQNALNYTADDTANTLGLLDTDISKVAQSQSQLLNVITGGRTSLDTFEQGIYTLAQNFNQASGSTATVSTRLGTLSATAKVAGATISGTTAAAYSLNAAFYQQVSNAQSLIGALELQDISTRNLTTATATMAGQMLSFAGNNIEARTVIVDLINNALGPGTVSLQNLNSWVAQNSTSLQGLNSIVAQSTVLASHLAGVLQGQLNVELAQAALNALGGQKALTQFAQAVVSGNTSASQLAANGGAQVLKMFEQMYGKDIPAAKAAFVDWAKNGLGLSQTDASNLWNQLVKNQSQLQTITTLVNGPVKASFVTWAQSGLNLSQTAAANLWTELSAKLGPQLQNLGSSSVPGAEKAFVSWAENGLKLTQSQAQSLWGELQTLQTFINGMHGTQITITEHGIGQFQIYGGTTPGSTGGGAPGVPAAAHGRKITLGSGPTADDVLVRVSKGETIVSASDSRLLAPAFRALGIPGYGRGGIPGYASGGIPAGSGAISALVGQTQQFNTNFINQFTAAMEAAMTSAMKTDIAAAQAAATAAAAAGGGGSVANGATIASLAAAHGWTGSQLTALLNVIARESGGSTTATNPSSGAYGIAQFIGGASEYYTYGGNPNTVAGQVTAMLNYISQRYGSPAAAWQHELQYGWYDNGGVLKPGATLAWNGTGRNEMVTTGGHGTDQGINILNELRRQNYYMQQLIQTVTSVPAATGQHVGAAINGAAGQANWNHRYSSRGW